MKQISCILLFLCFSIQVQAQLEEPILRDTMTLSQAKYELQREMATINYYYFQDYYGQKLGDRFKYNKKFADKVSDFELLSQDTIVTRMMKKSWQNSMHHTNRSEESIFWISHNFRGEMINKAKLSTPRSLKNSFVPQKVFYYGSTESNPDVLKTDNWYKNRKHIDSILIDMTIYYPTEIKAVSVSSTIAEKKDFGNGGFLWLVSNDGNYMDVAATDDIVNNLASIHAIGKDGTRYDHSRNTYTPKQPSTEMFSYASTCYTYCRQLVQNIDDGKYRSIKDLLKEFDDTRPVAPKIKWVFRYAFKSKDNLEAIEFKYYTKYDSISLPNVMAYDFIARKGDYTVVEKSTGNRIIRGIADKDGKWIIKPSTNTGIIDEVAGIFYKINDRVDHTGESYDLVYVDEKNKRFVKPNFELKENINDKTLIVEKDELFGMVHRSGKQLLPFQFSAINYNKKWNVFIAKLSNDAPKYQLYLEDGKLALPKTYRLIEIKGDKLYTTEIKNDEEIVEAYDKTLKLIKDETVISTREAPTINEPESLLAITDQLIIVRDNNLMGVNDKAGNTIIPIIYSTLWYDMPTNVITAMTEKRQFLLFDVNGKRALPDEYRKITQKNGLIYVSKIVKGNEVTSVYDNNIKQINPKNTWVESEFNINDEPILAKDKNGHQFFMNRQGQKVLLHSQIFQYLDGFHSDRALVMPRRYAPTNPVFGYISSDGKTAISFSYTKAYSFRGKYAYVEDSDKAMFINVDNKIFKELPAKAKNVYLSDNLDDTRYWLTNGNIYDGYANLIE